MVDLAPRERLSNSFLRTIRFCSMMGAMSELPNLRLFVFKEGLLSRLGHDLRLRVDAFELTLETGVLVGRFATESIRVDGAMKKGALDPGGLSEKDKAKVENTVREEILQTERYPEIVFEASLEPRGDTAEIRGSLTVLGRRRALDSVRILPMGEQFVASLTIEPSRWGIKPYKGLAGALKIRDRVDVELAVPADFALDSIEARRWARQP